MEQRNVSTGSVRPVREASFTTPAAFAAELFECYASLNAFPRWVLDPAFLSEYARYARTAITFYNAGDDKAFGARVLMGREPVNIACQRHHDVGRFARLTKFITRDGWRESYYQTHWTANGDLAPNIAVYCKTPGVPYDQQNATAAYPAAEALELRILNVIGHGFDSPAQPDSLKFARHATPAAFFHRGGAPLHPPDL